MAGRAPQTMCRAKNVVYQRRSARVSSEQGKQQRAAVRSIHVPTYRMLREEHLRFVCLTSHVQCHAFAHCCNPTRLPPVSFASKRTHLDIHPPCSIMHAYGVRKQTPKQVNSCHVTRNLISSPSSFSQRPGGLQLGHLMNNAGRDYIILEKDASAGTFFATHPRHRKLISLNKRFTG